LSGAAAFFRQHVPEELMHRDKFIDYLIECDAPVTVGAVAAPLNALHAVVLAAGAAASLFVAWRRRGTRAGRFALLVLAGVLANAAASGALSRPHDRYQARIAWLVLLPGVVGIRNRAGPDIA
jgi:hypothetical protein